MARSTVSSTGIRCISITDMLGTTNGSMNDVISYLSTFESGTTNRGDTIKIVERDLDSYNPFGYKGSTTSV